MPRSKVNDRTYPLLAGATFTGLPESTAEHIAITVNVLVPTNCTLTIQQSYNKATWLITEEYPILANTHKTVQQAVGLEYFRVILTNNGITQTFCHMVTTLSTSLTQNVNIRNLVATRDSVDISGQTIKIGGAITTDISGQYVNISTMPHLSKTTDSVDISGQTVLIGGAIACDISGQHVIVSSTPYLSKTTSSVDISGQTVVLGTGNNVVGKILTFENPSSVISLTGLGDTGQTIKNSPGSLFNLTCFNDGNAISYIKLYNVAVPTASDTPVMTLPILHDSPINTISVHNYQFSTAIGIRASSAYLAGSTSPPNGTTSVTAFYNGVSP